MKTSEHFALDQWLSEYPDELTYEQIIAILRDPNNTWHFEDIYVWEVVEDCTLDQVATFIEDTKKHFERVTS